MKLCKKYNVEYVNHEVKQLQNKRRTCVNFICPSHREQGIQTRKFDDFKRLRCICTYCSHNNTKKIADKVAKMNPEITLLGNYINWDTKIKCRCESCGTIWYPLPSTLLRGSKCPNCAKENMKKKLQMTTEEYISKLRKVNPSIEVIGEYQGTHNPIKCKCKKDGTIWESFACNILNGSAICPKCAKEKLNKKYKLSKENFYTKVSTNYPTIEIIDSYENYKNNNSRIKCRCKIHDNVYYVSARRLLYNHNAEKSAGCVKCNQSAGEKRIIYCLEKHGIDYTTQQTFEGCQHKLPLRYDVYCKQFDLAIEFQGQQHFYPVAFGSSTEEEALDQFIITQKCDNIKKEFCKANNMQLLEIPYWEYDNIEKIILNKIS